MVFRIGTADTGGTFDTQGMKMPRGQPRLSLMGVRNRP